MRNLFLFFSLCISKSTGGEFGAPKSNHPQLVTPQSRVKSAGKHKVSACLIAGVVIASMVLVCLAILVLYLHRKKRKNGAWNQPSTIPIEELRRATNNFSAENIVGEGGFGIILMELITGRKVVDKSLGEEDSHLVVSFRRHTTDGLVNLVDSSLDRDELESIFQVSKLACHCAARKRNKRPTIGYAVQVLSLLVNKWVPSNSNYEDDSSISPTQELEWQCDTESTMYTTCNGSWVENISF